MMRKSLNLAGCLRFCMSPLALTLSVVCATPCGSAAQTITAELASGKICVGSPVLVAYEIRNMSTAKFRYTVPNWDYGGITADLAGKNGKTIAGPRKPTPPLQYLIPVLNVPAGASYSGKLDITRCLPQLLTGDYRVRVHLEFECTDPQAPEGMERNLVPRPIDLDQALIVVPADLATLKRLAHEYAETALNGLGDERLAAIQALFAVREDAALPEWRRVVSELKEHFGATPWVTAELERKGGENASSLLNSIYRDPGLTADTRASAGRALNGVAERSPAALKARIKKMILAGEGTNLPQ